MNRCIDCGRLIVTMKLISGHEVEIPCVCSHDISYKAGDISAAIPAMIPGSMSVSAEYTPDPWDAIYAMYPPAPTAFLIDLITDDPIRVPSVGFLTLLYHFVGSTSPLLPEFDADDLTFSPTHAVYDET